MQSPADDAAEPAVPDAPDPRPTRRTRSLWQPPTGAWFRSSPVVALVAATRGRGRHPLPARCVTPILGDRANSSTIYYSDGTVLAHLDRARTQALRWDQFSDIVVQAAVAAQDPDFWTDEGGALTRSVVRIGTERPPAALGARPGPALGRRPEAGRGPDQAEHPRVLPERGAARPGHVRRRGGGAGLLRQDRPPRRRAGRGAHRGRGDGADGAARRPGRTTTRSAPRPRRPTRIAGGPRSATSCGTTDICRRAPPPPSPTRPPPGRYADGVADRRLRPGRPGGAARRRRAGGHAPVRSHDLRPARHRRPEDHEYDLVARPATAGTGRPTAPRRVRSCTGNRPPWPPRRSWSSRGPAGCWPTTAAATGNGADYAGTYIDDTGTRVGFGAHPAGGMFGVHVLAAGLQAGMSVQSRWSPAVVDLPGRTGGNAVHNTSVCAEPVHPRDGDDGRVQHDDVPGDPVDRPRQGAGGGPRRGHRRALHRPTTSGSSSSRARSRPSSRAVQRRGRPRPVRRDRGRRGGRDGRLRRSEQRGDRALRAEGPARRPGAGGREPCRRPGCRSWTPVGRTT